MHGFSANKTMWMIMSRHLPKSWRLVMLDMPGHGESGFQPNGDYSAEGMTAKLDEVQSNFLLYRVAVSPGTWSIEAG